MKQWRCVVLTGNVVAVFSLTQVTVEGQLARLSRPYTIVVCVDKPGVKIRVTVFAEDAGLSMINGERVPLVV